MGAWGAGAFENDYAADWLIDFEAAPSDAALAAVFRSITGDGGRDHHRRCAEAVAAAAIVRLRLGKPGEPPPQVGAWLEQAPTALPPELANEARRALTLLAERSELRAAWRDSADFETWWSDFTALRADMGDEAGGGV